MMDAAPSCALVSIRTNWEPYILEAVQAVMNSEKIESFIKAHDHGRDLSAGFESGWVEMLELNRFIAAPGTEEKMERAIDSLKKRPDPYSVELYRRQSPKSFGYHRSERRIYGKSIWFKPNLRIYSEGLHHCGKQRERKISPSMPDDGCGPERIQPSSRRSP